MGIARQIVADSRQFVAKDLQIVAETINDITKFLNTFIRRKFTEFCVTRRY